MPWSASLQGDGRMSREAEDLEETTYGCLSGTRNLGIGRTFRGRFPTVSQKYIIGMLAARPC